MKTFIFLGIFFIFQILSARTIIVAETGGDYTSVQAALNSALAGDSILVKEKSTPYYEKINFPRGGDAANGYITLTAYPGEHPVLDGSGVANNGASYTDDMVYMENISYVRLSGFEIRNVNTPEGSGVRVYGYGAYIEIRDNDIHEIRGGGESGGAMGITVYGADDTNSLNHIIIDNNHIHDCDPAWSEALTLNGNVEQFEVTRNLIEDVNNIGIDFIGGEDWLSSKFARNGRCAWNRVYRANASYEDGYAAGIYVDGGSDIIIENNTVSGCDLGIEVGAENAGVLTSGVTVRNNIVYKNNKTGIVFGGYDVTTGRVKNCSFTGNTCYDNDVLNTGHGELWIQYAEDNDVRNNIFYANDQNLLLYSENGNINNTIDYNLWNTGAGEGSANFVWNGTLYGSFAAYQSATGQDSHSAFGNPLFVNAAAADFHISGTSPAVDLGDPAYSPAEDETDMDGQTRLNGSRVDAGADETDATSTSNIAPSFPRRFALRAYPNPFNPQTILRMDLAWNGLVTLEIYNTLGQKVKTLFHGLKPAGSFTLSWDGRDAHDRPCPAGIYLARLRQKSKNMVLKLTLVK